MVLFFIFAASLFIGLPWLIASMVCSVTGIASGLLRLVIFAVCVWFVWVAFQEPPEQSACAAVLHACPYIDGQGRAWAEGRIVDPETLQPIAAAPR